MACPSMASVTFIQRTVQYASGMIQHAGVGALMRGQYGEPSEKDEPDFRVNTGLPSQRYKKHSTNCVVLTGWQCRTKYLE